MSLHQISKRPSKTELQIFIKATCEERRRKKDQVFCRRDSQSTSPSRRHVTGESWGSPASLAGDKVAGGHETVIKDKKKNQGSYDKIKGYKGSLWGRHTLRFTQG